MYLVFTSLLSFTQYHKSMFRGKCWAWDARARAHAQCNMTPLQSFYFANILMYAEEKCTILKKNELIRILFLRIGTHAEVCSSSTSYSSLFTCVSRYWMRKVRSSQESTRFCSAVGSCWTEKISRTNPCRGCRMKLGTTSRNSTSCPDFTDSFLLLSNSREIGTIGAYNVVQCHIVISSRYFDASTILFDRSFSSFSCLCI